MGFLEVVAELRQKLGVDAELSVPAAVNQMSEMMGLDTVVYPGKVVPLPLQVEALCESLNFSMPLAGEAAASGDSLTEPLQGQPESSSDDEADESLEKRHPSELPQRKWQRHTCCNSLHSMCSPRAVLDCSQVP